VLFRSVELADLFFNTPARLKFLKSDAYERGRLAAAVEEAALANPSVGFTYKSESRIALRFAPETGADPVEGLRRRARQILGAENAADLLPIVIKRPEIALTLFVSRPDALVATRELQYWFVNRRPVSARILQQALYRAFADRPPDRHPVCIGHLELPGENFDVNVHPGKREIRFKSDRDIFELVSGLVASALLKSKPVAPIVPETRHSSFREDSPGYRASTTSIPLQTDLDLNALPMPEAPQAEEKARWFTPPFSFLGQIERAYLVFEAAGGLFILDQHAAAERVLFEKYLSEIESGGARTQRLMIPMTLQLPASAVSTILSRAPRLDPLGFTFEPFGKTGLRCLSVPAMFQRAADLKEMVHRLLDAVADPVAAAQAVRHDAVATLACKAAVKAHDPLSEREAFKLIEDLKQCRDSSCCPHGRRTMLALDRDELARRFQRPGAPPL
jgi:DNA mismatch repair protein MutL